MRQQFTVGVVGAGNIATTAHIPLLRAMADTRIAWIADVNESRARTVARNNRIPVAKLSAGVEALPACDVMLLATPLPSRQSYFDHCSAAKIAVLAEKPLQNSAAAHSRVVAQFRGTPLSVGYQRRFYSSSHLLRQLIRERMFGPLQRLELSEGGRIVRTGGVGGYQDLPTSQGGGLLKNLGCHSLDLALWLTDARNYVITTQHVDWDDMTDRHAEASIQLHAVGGASGSECTLVWACSWLQAQRNMCELHFEHAVVRCAITPTDHVLVFSKSGQLIARLQVPLGGATTSAQAFYLEWRDLLDAIESRQQPMSSGESCFKTAQLIDDLLGIGA